VETVQKNGVTTPDSYRFETRSGKRKAANALFVPFGRAKRSKKNGGTPDTSRFGVRSAKRYPYAGSATGIVSRTVPNAPDSLRLRHVVPNRNKKRF